MSQGRCSGVYGGKIGQGLQSSGLNRPEQDPNVQGGRRVVFLASDDDAGAADIGSLAQTQGFAQIEPGGLSAGGLLVQARGNSWGHLIFKDLVKPD